MKLEIGAWDTGKSGYIHTDLNLAVNNHIEVCCRGENLPFKNEIFEEVYMQGVFEHFTYQGAKDVLSECKRVLVSNGIIDFTVPDLLAACQIVLSGRIPFNEIPPGADYNRCKFSAILGYALGCLYGGQERPGQVHQAGWSRDLITEYLDDAGFIMEECRDDVYEKGTHLHIIARKR